MIADASGRAPIRIATNFERMQQLAGSVMPVEQVDLETAGSLGGLRALLAGRPEVDLIIVDIDGTTLLRLCLLRLFSFRRRPRIVSVDILVARPVGLREWLVAWIKRQLLRQVDLFVLYFRDLGGYSRYYGITDARSAYVPFKANCWEGLDPSTLDSGGAYVLTAGRTKRDLATFLEAMRRSGLPGVLLLQPRDIVESHGTVFPEGTLPPNVRLVMHDGERATWADHIRGARIVVLPIIPGTISSSGIGTYIDAMALKKAVIITEGAATTGILTDQAVVIPPADPAALAREMTRLWLDDAARDAVATRARAYAETLQGEERLLQDILRVSVGRLLPERH